MCLEAFPADEDTSVPPEGMMRVRCSSLLSQFVAEVPNTMTLGEVCVHGRVQLSSLPVLLLSVCTFLHGAPDAHGVCLHVCSCLYMRLLKKNCFASWAKGLPPLLLVHPHASSTRFAHLSYVCLALPNRTHSSMCFARHCV